MIWIIGSVALILYGVVLMCIMIVGGRADDGREPLFINSFETEEDINVFSLSPTIPDRVEIWAAVQPSAEPIARIA